MQFQNTEEAHRVEVCEALLVLSIYIPTWRLRFEATLLYFCIGVAAQDQDYTAAAGALGIIAHLRDNILVIGRFNP